MYLYFTHRRAHVLALLKLGYAMHTQWYVIHTILLHTSGVLRFGMKYTPLCAHYLMALAPPIL